MQLQLFGDPYMYAQGDCKSSCKSLTFCPCLKITRSLMSRTEITSMSQREPPRMRQGMSTATLAGPLTKTEVHHKQIKCLLLTLCTLYVHALKGFVV